MRTYRVSLMDLEGHGPGSKDIEAVGVEVGTDWITLDIGSTGKSTDTVAAFPTRNVLGVFEVEE